MLFKVQQPLEVSVVNVVLHVRQPRKIRKFSVHSSKNAHNSKVGLSSTSEILLATVEDRERFWRGHLGWRPPLAFLAHSPNASPTREATRS